MAIRIGALRPSLHPRLHDFPGFRSSDPKCACRLTRVCAHGAFVRAPASMLPACYVACGPHYRSPCVSCAGLLLAATGLVSNAQTLPAVISANPQLQVLAQLLTTNGLIPALSGWVMSRKNKSVCAEVPVPTHDVTRIAELDLLPSLAPWMPRSSPWDPTSWTTSQTASTR